MKIATRLGWLLISSFFLSPKPAVAQANEYDVKAAYILQFAKFVEWPSTAFSSGSAPIIVGIVGADPFNGRLASHLSGETVAGRRFSVRRVEVNESLRECHILFLSSSTTSQISNILSIIRGKAILTIGDREGFASQGAVIGFYFHERKVRFEVNTAASKTAGITISSKVLSLARIVK